jgi:cytochrome c5
MSHTCTLGGLATVRILDRSYYRNPAFPVFLALAVGFGILVTPCVSRAQSGSGPGQDTVPSAAPAAPSPQARKPVVLPEGDGKEIAEKSCQACHELTNLTHASKSQDDWRDTVQIMVDNGADIPADKVDVLVKYLAKNFGPKTNSSASDAHSSVNASASKPAGLPDGDGKEIATNSCQSCHTLTNLTDAHKNADQWRETVQLMIDRGADVPADKIDILVNYLAKNFCPKDPTPAGDVSPQSAAKPQ